MKRLILCLVLGALALPVFAQNRSVQGLDSELSSIELTENDRYLVVGDETTSEMVFIDPLAEVVVARQPVPSSIKDITAVDETTVLVATAAGLYEVSVTDSVPFGDPLPGSPVSVDYDGKNVVAVGVGSSFGSVVLMHAKSGKITSTIDFVYQPLVRIDGNRLFVGEQSISPASLYHYRLHPKKGAIFVAEDPHGSLGSNLAEFVISGDYVYVACGVPYGIQRVEVASMTQVGVMDTGAYPAGVAVADGQVFGLPQSAYNNFLFSFDEQNSILTNAYELFPHVTNGQSQRRGVAVLEDGSKAFVLHGYQYYGQVQVQVVDL